MPWLKCPFGCIFEVADGVMHTPATNLHTCPGCHRQQAFNTYTRADKSHAIGVADKVHATQTQTPQQAIDAVVIQRIKKVMDLKEGWFTASADAQAGEIYNKLMHLLMNAEITSNFPTAKLPLILKSGKFLNMWHFEVKDKKYAKERDATEKTAFTAYSSEISSFVDSGPKPINPSAVERPVYLALSVGNFLCGGAPNYGQSYVIFKDAVKTRCTFTATDTIQMAKQSHKLASSDVYGIGTIASILLRISDRYLRFLASYANHTPIPKVFEFIEAHAWGELYLHQDIKAIVISGPDLERMVIEKSSESEHIPADWISLNAEQRGIEIAKMRAMLEDFCAEHKIQLYYLKLDKETMNSTLQREGSSAKTLAPVAQGASSRWYMVSPQDRARIGLDRLDALSVGRHVTVIDPATQHLLARGTVTWEHGNSMTVQFDEVLAPGDRLFSFGGQGSSLRFDKGSAYIRL